MRRQHSVRIFTENCQLPESTNNTAAGNADTAKLVHHIKQAVFNAENALNWKPPVSGDETWQCDTGVMENGEFKKTGTKTYRPVSVSDHVKTAEHEYNSAVALWWELERLWPKSKAVRFGWMVGQSAAEAALLWLQEFMSVLQSVRHYEREIDKPLDEETFHKLMHEALVEWNEFNPTKIELQTMRMELCCILDDEYRRIISEDFSTTPTVLNVNQATINVLSDIVHVDSAYLKQSSSNEVEKPKKTPLIHIKYWSELALGIDEKKSYWAITPPPQFNGQVFKSKAVELPLVGASWFPMFELFADSDSGNRIAMTDFVTKLKINPKGTGISADSRAKPGAIEADLRTELQQSGSVVRQAINNKLKELARTIREYVSGTKPGSDRCFRMLADEIECAFDVGYIVESTNGSHKFCRKSDLFGG
jgi:hypothetical protein